MMGMLVLKRRIDETIAIGEGESVVTLKVLDAGPGWVRLGFEGPQPIWRGEIADEIAAGVRR